MHHHSPYYKPSGEAPILGIIAYFLVGLVAVCLLAGLSCLVAAGLRLMFLVVGLGFGIAGAALYWAVKQFHIRAPFKIAIFTIILGCAYGYCLWLLLNYSANQSARDILGAKTGLYTTLAILAAASLAFIILGGVFPWRAAWKPYSEACKRWATEIKLPYAIDFIFDAKEAKQAFEKGDFSLLFNEKLRSMEQLPLSTFTLYYVPEDPDCYYLSVVNVMKKEDIHGRDIKKENKVIMNVKITFDDFRKFQARFNPQTKNS